MVEDCTDQFQTAAAMRDGYGGQGRNRIPTSSAEPAFRTHQKKPLTIYARAVNRRNSSDNAMAKLEALRRGGGQMVVADDTEPAVLS